MPVENTIVIAGRRAPGEASVSSKAMRYLPFEVPRGVTRITIGREFDHGPNAARKNTVDFGLWDNRGTETGFRGWQGGSPGDFVIAGVADACSPHAVPGPLPAGRWHIAQYYLVAAPTGLGYKYTITFAFDGPKPPRAFSPPPRYEPGVVRRGPAWYAGNLHAHTLHSDGGRTLPDMVGRCALAGFDFVASTEHNSPTAHYRFPQAARAHPGVLLLYGDEFTSPFGHANIIGQKPGHWFDFRIDGGDKRLLGVIDEAHRQEAIFVVNHPFAPCTSCPWRYPGDEWKNADAIEVWNGTWTPDDGRALALWDRLLKSGRKIHALGGTDYHRGGDALTPATFVYADNLSRPAVMEGLRKGRAFLSEGPRGPKLFLSVPGQTALPGDTVRVAGADPVPVQVRVEGGKGMTLRLVGAQGETVLPVQSDAATLRASVGRRPAPNASYVRAELLRPGGAPAALTNPLYLAGT